MAEDTHRSRSTPRRPYPKGIARRMQILDTAMDEIAEVGVEGMSLRTLAEAIGVSHATLRHYFTSRDELLVEVYRDHERRAYEATGRSVDDWEREIDGQTDVIGFVTSQLHRNAEIPGMTALFSTLIFGALQNDHPVTTEFILGRFRLVRRAMTTILAAAQSAGEVDEDLDPADLAALVTAVTEGLMAQALVDPDEVDVHRALSVMDRLLRPSVSSRT